MPPAHPESFQPPGSAATSRADPRDAVCRRLARQARRFPDLAITRPDDDALSPRDAALASAIHDAVIRRWITLDHLLETVSGRPLETLEPKMRAVLLSGAAQILLLDRIPPHAAINESVNWAKRAVRHGAGAMANAVLRKIADLRSDQKPRDTWTNRADELPLQNGTARVLAHPALPADERERRRIALSLPSTLVERWRRHAPDRADHLTLHTLATAPTVINVAHAQHPTPDDAPLAPHRSHEHRVFTGTRDQLVELLRDRPDLWVQDAASSRPVRQAAHLRPSLVIDVCAGQGTKTRQLCAQFPEARVVAAEVDRPRLETLRTVFAAHPRVTVTRVDRLMPDLAGQADLVLLDVPCSNSGVLPRRPEARYRFNDQMIARLAALQRQIIADAIPLLSPAGTILYSTCSLEDEENRAQAAWAAAGHDLRLLAEHQTWPSGTPGDDAGTYRDASYAALLAR